MKISEGADSVDDVGGHWAVICPTLIYCSSNKDRQWDAFSEVDALHSNERLITIEPVDDF